jgi:hypothetical protein
MTPAVVRHLTRPTPSTDMIPPRHLIAGQGSEQVLIFLPGFMTPVAAYRDLLTPLAIGGVEVHLPQLYRPGLRALAGSPTVQEEAKRAALLVSQLAASKRPVWLAGHSRGGQAAWRAAELTHVSGLILVDPVDGAGRATQAATTSRPPSFSLTPTVIGAGMNGPCNPAVVDHRRFAAVSECQHLVISECGHGDMLSGLSRAAARALCRGGPDPVAARQTTAHLLQLAMAGRLTPTTTRALPLPVEWL